MQILCFRNILEDFWKNKIKIAILVTILVVIMGMLGFKKSETPPDPSVVESAELYEESIIEYEEVIAELEESIVLAEKQVKELEEYETESLYMKMDPQEIFVAETQYGIKSENNVTYIMNSLVMYINEGKFWGDEAEEQENISEKYLKELVKCSASGNVFQVSVMAPSQEQANSILEILKQQLSTQKSRIEGVQGVFTMQEISSSEYVKADTAVLNAQNTVRNNLKTYKTNLSDLKKKLIDQKANRKNYMEYNEAEMPEEQNGAKTVLKYVVFGVVLGVLIPLAWFGLKYIMNNAIKNQDELLAAGIPVLGVLDKKQKNADSLTLAVLDIQLLAQKREVGQVAINSLSEEKNVQEVLEKCAEEISKEGVSSVIGVDMQNDTGKLREMINTGNCVLIAELGKTKYAQIEEQIQLAQKFQISIWGCILVG